MSKDNIGKQLIKLWFVPKPKIPSALQVGQCGHESRSASPRSISQIALHFDGSEIPTGVGFTVYCSFADWLLVYRPICCPHCFCEAIALKHSVTGQVCCHVHTQPAK